MKASETLIMDFLKTSQTKFVIPIYQRNYDWEKKQCQQLLNDIKKETKQTKSGHFIGSIVYITDESRSKRIFYNRRTTKNNNFNFNIDYNKRKKT